MAKQKGIYKLGGTLDGISHYTMKKHGDVVRRKAGPSRRQILTGKQFRNMRNNMSEFRLTAWSGKLIRHAVLPWVKDFGDSDVTSRLAGRLQAIKCYDTSNAHGKRHVRYAFHNPAARDLLSSFAFHEQWPLSRVLYQRPVCDPEAGTVTLHNFLPERDCYREPGTTHVRLTAAFVSADFEDYTVETIYSKPVLLSFRDVERDVVLKAKDKPEAAELWICYLLAEAFQEVNGLKQLKTGSAMGVILVG